MNIPEDIKEFLHDVDNMSRITYAHEYDEIGACIECRELSYRPHASSCVFAKIKTLIAKYDPPVTPKSLDIVDKIK